MSIKIWLISLLAIIIVSSFTVKASAVWPFSDETTIESGKNYDQKIIKDSNGVKQIQFTSKPDRLEDYQNHFIDYRYFDTADHLTFESAGPSITLNKQSCTLRFFGSGKVTANETPLVDSVQQILKEAQNGTDAWNVSDLNNESCAVSFTDTGKGIQLTAMKTNMDWFGQGVSFKSVYDIDYSGKVKQTFQIKNNDNDKSDMKFGFTQIMTGDYVVRVGDAVFDTSTQQDVVQLDKSQLQDQIISITKDGFTILYDPQNYIHDYLWAVKIESHKIVFDFTSSKGRLAVGDTLEIDPTFSQSGSNSARIQTTSTNTAGKCSTVYSSNSASFFAYQPVTGTNDVCQFAVTEFDISSLAGKAITVSSAYVDLTVNVVDNSKPCQVRKLTSNLSTINQLDLNDAEGGVILVNSDSDCSTTGGSKQLNFDSGSLSNIAETIRNGTSTYAVAIGCPPTSDRPATTRCNFEFASPSISFVYVLNQVRYENKPLLADSSAFSASTILHRSNSTGDFAANSNSTGYSTFTNTVNGASYNYTTVESLDNFAVNKTINKKIAAPQSQTGTTQVYNVDCSPGVDTDFRVKANFTNYHMLTLTTPACNSDGDISFTAQFLKQGLGPQSNQTTKFISRVIDTSEYTWLPGKLTINGTAKTGTYLANVVNFTGIQVGNGYNTIAQRYVLYTDNVTSAPQNLHVNAISSTAITLYWTAPASNHGAYPYSYAVYRNGVQIQNSTGNVLTYADGGLVAGTTYSYAVCAWNRMGCSPTAVNSNSTYALPAGNISLVSGNVGDVVNVNATITMTAGNPVPTITDVYLYRNNTLVKTNSTDIILQGIGSSGLSRIFYQITNDGLNIFHVRATMTSDFGSTNLSSANTNVTREYEPDYHDAQSITSDPALGQVNFTAVRFDGDEQINLKVNRDFSGDYKPVNCKFQTALEALARDDGIWRNKTSGYYNTTISVSSTDQIYVTCYNPPGILFTTTVWGNSTENPLKVGIAIFDSFGGLMGGPSILLIVIAVFSMATGRNSPQVLVLALIITGILGAIGLLVIEGQVWSMLLVAGAVGIFAMKRYYF